MLYIWDLPPVCLGQAKCFWLFRWGRCCIISVCKLINKQVYRPLVRLNPYYSNDLWCNENCFLHVENNSDSLALKWCRYWQGCFTFSILMLSFLFFLLYEINHLLTLVSPCLSLLWCVHAQGCIILCTPERELTKWLICVVFLINYNCPSVPLGMNKPRKPCSCGFLKSAIGHACCSVHISWYSHSKRVLHTKTIFDAYHIVSGAT